MGRPVQRRAPLALRNCCAGAATIALHEDPGVGRSHPAHYQGTVGSGESLRPGAASRCPRPRKGQLRRDALRHVTLLVEVEQVGPRRDVGPVRRDLIAELEEVLFPIAAGLGFV